jgi:hemoglobin/transferrin/lactoferrin receptor protein
MGNDVAMVKERKRIGSRARLLGSVAGLAILFAGGDVVATAMAQESAATASAARVAFAIPAQDLNGAVLAYARTAGVRVLYDTARLRGIASPGVSGSLSRSEAMAALLSGTGLSFTFTGANVVRVHAPGAEPSAGGGSVSAPGTLVLETIDVNAGGVSGGVSAADLPFETPGSTAFISRQELDRVPPTRPGDVFNGTPGVLAASKNTGGAIDVNIRGLQGMNRVKVMVDGTQQDASNYRNYQGFDNRSYFDPELLSGIEIEKGPGTGAYSSGTMGGVVNMRTLSTDDILLPGRSYGVRARGSLGDNAIAPLLNTYLAPGRPAGDEPDTLTFDNRIGSIAGAIRIDDFDFVGALASRHQGNYFAGNHGEISTTTAPGGEVPNTSIQSISGLAKGTLRWFDGQSLELGYSSYDADVGYQHPVYSAWYKGQARLSTVGSDRYTAQYRWQSEKYDWIDLRANLWAATLRSQEPNPTLPVGHQQMDSDSWGSEVWNRSSFSLGAMPVTLNYGVEYSSVGMHAVNIWSATSSTPVVDGDREVLGSHFTAGFDPTSWLNLTAGARYDAYWTSGNAYFPDIPEHTASGGKFLPNFSATVTPLDGLQIFGKYTEGMRVPSVREVAGEAMFAYMTPNPELKPELSKNWEFGANYLSDAVFFENDKARLKAVYFNNHITDYISRSATGPDAGCPIVLPYSTCFINADQATFEGIELTAAYDAGRAFIEATLNYYIKVDIDASDGQWGSAYAPPELTSTISAGLRFLDEKLTIGGRANYVGERSVPFTTYGVYAPPLWTTNIWTGDLFASYEPTEHLRLDLSIENVGDLYYVDPLSITTIPAPGRTIRAGLTARF